MKKFNKENSVLVSGTCAAGRFIRGVVGVATLGISELGIAAGKGLVGLFKRNDSDECDDLDDFDDFDDFDETEVASPMAPAYEYDCSSSDLAEAARVAEEDAEINAIVDKAIQSQNENQ